MAKDIDDYDGLPEWSNEEYERFYSHPEEDEDDEATCFHDDRTQPLTED